jgi:hypothetical protein
MSINVSNLIEVFSEYSTDHLRRWLARPYGGIDSDEDLGVCAVNQFIALYVLKRKKK